MTTLTPCDTDLAHWISQCQFIVKDRTKETVQVVPMTQASGKPWRVEIWGEDREVLAEGTGGTPTIAFFACLATLEGVLRELHADEIDMRINEPRRRRGSQPIEF